MTSLFRSWIVPELLTSNAAQASMKLSPSQLLLPCLRVSITRSLTSMSAALSNVALLTLDLPSLAYCSGLRLLELVCTPTLLPSLSTSTTPREKSLFREEQNCQISQHELPGLSRIFRKKDFLLKQKERNLI